MLDHAKYLIYVIRNKVLFVKLLKWKCLELKGDVFSRPAGLCSKSSTIPLVKHTILSKSRV